MKFFAELLKRWKNDHFFCVYYYPCARKTELRIDIVFFLTSKHFPFPSIFIFCRRQFFSGNQRHASVYIYHHSVVMNAIGVVIHALLILTFLWSVSISLYLDSKLMASFVSAVFTGSAGLYLFKYLTEPDGKCPVGIAAKESVGSKLVVKESHLDSNCEESFDEKTNLLEDMMQRLEGPKKSTSIHVYDIRVPRRVYDSVRWQTDLDWEAENRGKWSTVNVKSLIGIRIKSGQFQPEMEAKTSAKPSQMKKETKAKVLLAKALQKVPISVRFGEEIDHEKSAFPVSFLSNQNGTKTSGKLKRNHSAPMLMNTAVTA